MTQQELEAIDTLTQKFRETLIKSLENTSKAIIDGYYGNDTFERYLSAIARYYCLDKNIMRRNRSRRTEHKTGRQILWFLSYFGDSKIPYSLQRIGFLTDVEKPFSHATVIHGAKVIREDIDVRADIRHDVREIVKSLGMELVKVRMNWTTRLLDTE